MMQYYFRNKHEAEFCDRFDALTRQYRNIRFFQPSPAKAPWHVQAVLDAGEHEPIVLNFWPHKQKASRQGLPSTEGPDAARDVIEEALTDQALSRSGDCTDDLIERF